ncbi:MAG: GIY-YIG nuclease family protein [Pseudomonadota bacterium]
MTDFFFQELLERRGVAAEKSRLVRHDRRGLACWVRGRDAFDDFASVQRPEAHSPYKGVELVHQFVAEVGTSALYVGSHRILARWSSLDDLDRRPRLSIHGGDLDQGSGDRALYDLDRVSELNDLAGRVVIDWGRGAIAWSQWTDRNPKPILELRAAVRDPDWPGFERFGSRVKDVPTLPSSWRGLLASVGGVYLIVAEDGAQYVGSAYGEGGFLQRWTAYAADGHGGNTLLKDAPVFDAALRVLKVMDPSAAPADVIAEEARWKDVLGSRTHGLNAN